MSLKAYDIVVYGVTGFTGRLVLRYLQSVATQEGVRFAVAGRSKAKVDRVLQEEDVTVPVIVADAAKDEDLRAMVTQTRCIISLVGPYNLYGSGLVKACSEHGVHYVDLTGEPAWQAKMIKQHSASAIESKALIIHACGFDSIPSDLCTFLAVQRLKKTVGDAVKIGDVRSSFSLKGGFSGGTLATMHDSLSASKEDRKAEANPYALSPVSGKDVQSLKLVHTSTFDSKRTWGAFWVMAPANEKVVRRSWGLLEGSAPSSKVLAYGPDFTYHESLKVGGPVSAVITSAAIFAFFVAMTILPPFRWLVQKYGPQPGEGPSVEAQVNGWFRVDTTAVSVDKKHMAQVTMKGKGDPGYSATAKMITQSALSIVQDFDRLPPLARRGGPLTPATALGHVLVERLEKTGDFTFTEQDGQ